MSWLTWFLATPQRLLGAGAIAAIGVLTVRLQLAQRAQHKAEAEAAASRLAYTNALAHDDTTRILFEDSLRGVTRYAEQLRVESNTRLAAANREAMARADLQLRVDSLRLIVERPVTVDSADVRTTTFDSDSTDDPGPIHVTASVTVPAPPTPATWNVSVSPAPAFLTLELACQGDRARADVVGPPWLKVQLHHISQDPAICSPPPHAADRAQGWIRRHFSLGITAGIGVVRDNGYHVGPSVTLGLQFHP